MIKILIGIISGIVSGMGMGGGTILILILTCFFNINQKIAQATNLIFFVPTSIIASVINIRNKNINFKIALPFSIAGVIGVVIGSIISIKINNKVLKKLFAIFLILIAIYELYYWYKKYIKRNNKLRN